MPAAPEAAIKRDFVQTFVSLGNYSPRYVSQAA
jgi:hypothetical protein